MRARPLRASFVTAVAILMIVPAVARSRPATPQTSASDAVIARLGEMTGSSLGPSGGEVRSIALARTDPLRLYLGTANGHVFVSRDGASSWSEIPPHLPHDAAVDNVVVHPGNADIVYAAYWRPGDRGGLVRSRDGGTTWEDLDLEGEPSLRALALAPTSPRIVYAGGIDGVWRSDDGGDSWGPIGGQGLPRHFIESLAVDPRDPEHVYAGTWRQVYRSTDGGAAWRRVYEGMAVDRDVFSLAISPHDPDSILAGTCNFVYASSDSGSTWQVRDEGLARDHNRIHVLVHHPRRPEVVYAGTRGALYRSEDAGATWRIVIGGVTVTSIAIDERGERLFVATEERGVLVGSDTEIFREHNAGITTSRVVAFDVLPGAPRVLFAARADGPTAYSLHFSTDVGSTWQPLGVTPGLGEVLTVRAQSAPVNRVLVVGRRGWWSVFPGGRWVPVPAPPGELRALEIAHAYGGHIFAATTAGLYVAAPDQLGRRDSAAMPFDDDVAPLWHPVWASGPLNALALGNGELLAVGDSHTVRGEVEALIAERAPRVDELSGLDSPATDLALHPLDRGVAYAVTDHRAFRSDDGGASWSELPLPWPAADLRAVAVNPANPDEVLALDFRGAVYRGHGGGRFWLVLDDDEGLSRAWDLRVSPQAPGFALVATQGHGVRVVALDPS